MSDSNDTREGWTGIGKWWYAAAALVAVVVIGFVLVILLPDPDKNTGTSNPPTAPTPTSTPPSSPASTPSPDEAGWADGGCSGSGDDQVPHDAPDAEWVPLGSSTVPTSAEVGPKQVDGLLRRCYQHSPSGALFAVTNILAAANADPTSSAQAVRILTEQFTPGKGRDQALEDVQQPDYAPSALTAVAYQVTSCDPSRCNLKIVYELPAGPLAETSTSVVWSGGDWLIDGNVPGNGRSVTSVPPGFTAWGPER